MALGTVMNPRRYRTDKAIKIMWLIWTQVTFLLLPFPTCNTFGNLLLFSTLKCVDLLSGLNDTAKICRQKQ